MGNNTISIRHGVAWAGLAQISNLAIQLIGLLVLSRILSPKDYGLMAMVTVVVAFASLFRDFGTGAALIQKEELSNDLKSTVFWLNAALGLLLSAVIFTLSLPLARLFSQPQLGKLLMAMAPVFLILSLGIAQKAMLERAQKFKTIALIEISAGSVALLCAIYVALHGGGVYALISQSMASAILSGLLLWIIGHWRPSMIVSRDSLGSIWHFSSNLFVFNLVNYFQRNADSALIGKFLGPAELGVYSIAYRILLFPLQTFTFVITRASFPVYSRFQHRKEQIGAHYLSILGTIAFYTAPLMGIIWTSREALITTALGEQWLPSATILAWLAPVGFFQSMVSTSGTVLNAIGRSDILRNLGIIGNIFLVGSIALGLRWGIVGIAMCYCIANFIWVYPVIGTVLKQLRLPFYMFLKEVWLYAAIATVCCLLLRIFSKQILQNYVVSSFIQLVIVGAAFVASYILFLFVLEPEKLLLNTKSILRAKRGGMTP